jgi:hypothetical protein
MLRIKSSIYLTGQANHKDRNSKFQTNAFMTSSKIKDRAGIAKRYWQVAVNVLVI